MPGPGVSLFGFMTQPEAMQYLSATCVLASGQDPASLWQQAQANLGAPVPNAGRPDIQDIPASHAAYLAGVQQNPRFIDTVAGFSWSFKLVEIDPVLAFQIQIFTGRSGELTAPLTLGGPTLDELLAVSLPHTLEAIPYQISATQSGLVIESMNPNLRLLDAGVAGSDPRQRTAVGAFFGAASPLMQVIRFNGRCYLRNGYHRAYGARKAGATHIPCIFLEAVDYGQIGAIGSTFSRQLLESTNPPTLGHYGNDRGWPVELRRVRRVITVTWAEHSIAETN